MIQRPVIQIERARGHLQRLLKRPLFYLQRTELFDNIHNNNKLFEKPRKRKPRLKLDKYAIIWITPFCLTDVITECHHSKVLLDISLLV